jgi:histidinol phosphatase-like PHP family hydrolase
MAITDYHVHLSQNLTIDRAVELARARAMTFGIVEHPGASFDLATDEDLARYIERLRAHPVRVGLQPVHVGWDAAFSQEILDRLDYVLIDADTLPLDDGSYCYLWLHDNFIEDMDAFVERYMAHIVRILSEAKLDIFARPTFLPINFARHYDEIWTRARMQTIIDLARARDIALEIAENVRVPSLAFIKMAKNAGIKFTFGTNGRNLNAGNFHYAIEMAVKAGLTRDDMASF